MNNIELNSQQVTFLQDFFKAQLDLVNSKTNIIIINQILDKLNES